MSKRAAALGVAFIVAALQCRDNTGPAAGSLSLELSNVGANDRALLLEVAGTDTSARIDTVLAPNGSPYRVFAQRQAAARWRVIVTGNLTNGVVASITVPDRTRTTSYSGTILDVADATFSELAPGVRALTVSP